jgi:prefoldin subunit 5
MKYLIPKSYRVKHKILKFLSKERMKNGGENDVEDFTFSLKEISKEIGEKYEDVYDISDYLFYKKLLHFIKNENELMNPSCWVLDDGIELYSSFELINEGKKLNTTLISTITTSFLTVVVTVIAFLTIQMNYQDSKIYNVAVSKLYKKVDSLESEQLKTTKKILDLENSVQQMEYYQTNTQKTDKKKSLH